MRCPSCQSDNPSAAKFCMECGSKMMHVKSIAERRQISIMFCDLVGSTALSETLDAEELRELVRLYQRSCERAIQPYNGHIAQLLGDGLLVYFGYPMAHEDDAHRAVRCGLDILKNLQKLNLKFTEQNRPKIAVRIGIHSGSVVIGDLGGNLRTEKLAIGDTPNIAARVEGVAGVNSVAISQDTYTLTQGFFTCQSLGKKQLKGISRPLEIFQVLGESGVKNHLDALEQHELSPLVGREIEYQHLMDNWKSIKQKYGKGVLLMGEAGIGKSRLVRTLKEEIQKDNNICIRECRCSSYSQNSAFYPLMEMLTQLLQTNEDLGTNKNIKLKNILTEHELPHDPYLSIFANLLSLPLEEGDPNPQLAPLANKQKLMEGFTQIKKKKNVPVLLVFEDLHWADESSLEWIRNLNQQIGKFPALLLMTSRSGFSGTPLTPSSFEMIPLKRLAKEAILRICEHKCHGKPLPRIILDKIINKTDGVPLFVEELTKTILESGQLEERANRYEMESSLNEISIPSTIQSSLMARLDRLASAKEIAQIGSVIGREFSLPLLKRVTKRDDVSLQLALQQLKEAELVLTKESAELPTYIFKHALVQDAAYLSILKSRKHLIHQSVAVNLEEMFPYLSDTQPELLAHHYTQAKQEKKALPLWEKAGNNALQRNANLEALHHFEQSLKLINVIEAENQREITELRLLNSLGSAIMMTKIYSDEEAKRIFNRSWELCQKVDDSIEQLKALMGLFAGNFIGGNHLAAFGIATKALQMALDEQDDLLLVMSNSAIGISNLLMGKLEKAHFHFSEVLRLYDPSKHDAFSYLSWGHFNIHAGANMVWSLILRGYPDSAKKQSETLFSFIETRENHISYFHTHYWTSIFCLITKDWNSCNKITEKYLPIAQKYGDPFFITAATFAFNLSKAFLGNKEGLKIGEQIADQIEVMGAKGVIGLYRYLVGTCQLEYGNYEAVKNSCEKALKLMEQTGEEMYKAGLLRLKGEAILGETGNQLEAEKYFVHSLEIAREQKANWWELCTATCLAKLWKKQGKEQQAFELLNPVYLWFQEGFDTEDLKKAKILLDTFSLND